MPKSWLITGGCGFLGTSLITHLLKEDPSVAIRVLDNLTVGTREDLGEVCSFVEMQYADISRRPKGGQAELVAGDIKNYEVCRKSCYGIDNVIHLAANTGVAPSVADPRADMESNVIGTFNMLEAARINRVDKFVFASSGAPVGEVEPPIHEEKAPRPVSPYGASKLSGEGYCSAYYRTFGLKTVSLRFGNVYGPRSKHKSSVVAKFFKQALAGEILEIYGDGNQTRDFIYIDDLIRAVCLAVDPWPLVPAPSPSSPYGEVFQIATHKETTVNEITELIVEIVEKKTGKKVIAKYGEARLGDVKKNYSDISKARRMLGYNPEVELGSGLMMTWTWFSSSAV